MIETWKNDFRAFVNSLNLSRDDYKTMMEYIDEIPAVQPDHNADISKKADWIPCSGWWSRIHKCSQCGNVLDFDGVNAGRGDANFCPSCGADMRGTEDG